MPKSIENIIEKCQGISLDEMKDVALLKRTDTKFILPDSKLPDILKDIDQHYRVLEIKDRRIMNYKTIYFDTPNNEFYFEHHNGKIKRTKIRIRQYIDSDLYFFEIKKKDGRSVTNKSRLQITEFEDISSPILQDYIHQVTGRQYNLKPVLWNQFQRVTLVHKVDRERVTFDINLSHENNGSEKKVRNLAIFELKQEKFDINSPIAQALKLNGIRPYGFSKYCIGRTQIHEDIKHSAFKPKLLRLKKITA